MVDTRILQASRVMAQQFEYKELRRLLLSNTAELMITLVKYSWGI